MDETRRERKCEWNAKVAMEAPPDKRPVGSSTVQKRSHVRRPKGYKYSEEYKQSEQLKRLIKKAQMTEEELKEERQRNYFRRAAQLGSLDKDERQEYYQHRRKIMTDWRRNLDEEGKKRYKESLNRAQKKQFEKMKQDPVKFEKWKERIKDYQRQRWANAPEEEKLKRRTGFRIAQKRKKIREQLRSQQVPEEIIEQRVKEMEEAIWKEVFPEGKPPPKKRKRGTRPLTAPFYQADVSVNNFWCMRCKPWPRQDGTHRIVGFKTKSELLIHVKANHTRCYHLCNHCNLLKYSRKALSIHQQMCREIVGPQRRPF